MLFSQNQLQMISEDLIEAKRDLFRPTVDVQRVFLEFDPDHYIDPGSRYETLKVGIDRFRSDLREHLIKDLLKNKKLKKQIRDAV